MKRCWINCRKPCHNVYHMLEFVCFYKRFPAHFIKLIPCMHMMYDHDDDKYKLKQYTLFSRASKRHKYLKKKPYSNSTYLMGSTYSGWQRHFASQKFPCLPKDSKHRGKTLRRQSIRRVRGHQHLTSGTSTLEHQFV